jgi:DNA-binding NtrC family response regulator
MPIRKTVMCVSWLSYLATTREMLLNQAGYAVVSAIGKEQAISKWDASVDLLVLGHSLPRAEKQALIEWFKEHSKSPILSLLKPNQQKLPEADFGVEAHNPDDVVKAVREILPPVNR